jgi:hypothetical protein
MYYHQKDVTITNKCTLSAGHFDGHGGAPEQYRWYCLMRHVQGYSGSHWMSASGNYLLRIAPASTRATGIQTTINNYTNKAGRFDGHRNVAVQYRVHCPMEEVQGFTRSHWMPPTGQTLAPVSSIGHANAGFFWCLSSSNRQKRPQSTRITPYNNRGMTYQTDEKHLTSLIKYFVGGFSIAFNCLNNRFLLRVINQ